MSAPKPILLTTLMLTGLLCAPPDAQEITQTECLSTVSSGHILPTSLTDLLGQPASCERTAFERTDIGTRETYQLMWDEGVDLVVETHPPETGVYLIRTADTVSLPKAWLAKVKDGLAKQGWADIDWSRDLFPGPNAEHYSGSVVGLNAQVWIERDPAGDITWFRFSYAL